MENLNKKIKELGVILEEQRKLLFLQQEEVHRVYEERQKLIEERDKLLVSSFTWKELLYTDGVSESQVKYQELNTRLHELGLHSSRYFPDINQKAIQLHIYKDGRNFTKVLNGLKEVLPFILPLKDGYKKLSILEHTLSLENSYQLRTNDKEYIVVAPRYRENVLHKSNSLEKALKYIQDNLWYE